MLDQSTLRNLKLKSFEYRQHLVRLAHEHSFGVHIGGTLSLAEILTTLYFGVASVDPKDPAWDDRDRIVLSKGHGNLGLLTILAMKGFFPFSVFKEFNKLGSSYSMHSDSKVFGVEHSAGSLGHGLSVAVGMALAANVDQKDWRVFCILGDGEMMEGSNWEAMMSAAHFGLDRLTAIIDRNHLTQEGTTAETMRLKPLKAKGEAFGWYVLDVDGHKVEELWEAFLEDPRGKPKLIVANTIKGRGIAKVENTVGSHFGRLSEQQTHRALLQIDEERKKVDLDRT